MLQCAIVGRITKLPALKVSQTGRKWLSVSTKVVSGEDAPYVQVAYFGDDAEDLAAQLSVGDHIYAKGGGSVRSWDYNGRTYYGLSLAANRLTLLDHMPPPERAAKATEERNGELWDDEGRHRIAKDKKRAPRELGEDAEPFSDDLDDVYA